MKEEFNAGDKVYSLEGHAGEYVALTPKGHLVQFYYEASRGEDCYTELGMPTIVDKVFATAPVEKLDLKIVELETIVKELNDKRYAIHSEIKTMENDLASRKKEYAKYDGLSVLHDFMDKKIQYIVISNLYDFDIKPFQEALDTKDRYDAGLKLVSLFGNSKGDFLYQVNAYKDGSGYNTTIWPCRTYEDAISYVTDKLKVVLSDQYVKLNSYIFGHLVDQIKKYNLDIEIPAKLMADFIELKTKELDGNIASRQVDVDRIIKEKKEFLQKWTTND